MKKALILSSLLCSLLILSACQTIGSRQQANQLRNTLLGYEKALRWKQPSRIYSFLSPSLSDTANIPENIDNIRILSYKIEQPVYQKDEFNAYQTVSITFLFRDQQIQKKLTDQQHWMFDSDLEGWVRANPIPDFK